MAKISTNVPANPELYLTQDDGSLEKFSVGDKVTILMHNHKTYFEDRDINYSKEHYIDVWIHIDELRDVDFSECPGNSL